MKLRNMTSIYILREDCLLLLYRVGSRVVEPSWCGIGGHFEPEELNRPDRCILRELEEETGITARDITPPALRYITLRLKNGEVRQNYYYFAQLNKADFALPPCGEGELKWVPASGAMALDMPFTAKQVLAHYLETGRYGSALYTGSAEREGIRFLPLSEF